MPASYRSCGVLARLLLMCCFESACGALARLQSMCCFDSELWLDALLYQYVFPTPADRNHCDSSLSLSL